MMQLFVVGYSIEEAKRQWECVRKRQHPSEQSADREAQRLNALESSEIEAKSYECQHCHYWHVGRDRVRASSK